MIALSVRHNTLVSPLRSYSALTHSCWQRRGNPPIARALFLVIASLLFIKPALADIFMTTENVAGEAIVGESTASGYEGWVDVSSWGWGVTRAIESVNGTVGFLPGPAFSNDLVISKKVDSSSPRLAEYLFTANQIGSLTLVVTAPQGNGGQHNKVTEVKITNAVVSSISMSAAADSNEILDSISFKFNCMTLTTFGLNNAGVVEAIETQWDFFTNQARCSN